MVDGIPHYDYKGDIGLQENPALVAGWGLGPTGNLEAAAEWLVESQKNDGSWRYDFNYIAMGQAELEAGWASAISQGRALSVLAKAHRLTKDARYLRSAELATSFLRLHVSSGGVRTTLDDDLWFEEYPTDPPSYVLNGKLYLLTGLWDARDLVASAQPLYEEARTTVERNLHRWDIEGSRVAYDLYHQTLGIPPRWDPAYDAIHERLLRELNGHRPSPTIQHWLDRWYGDA